MNAVPWGGQIKGEKDEQANHWQDQGGFVVHFNPMWLFSRSLLP